MNLPVAESCLRNQSAIADALIGVVGDTEADLLELGSGTGQHAAYITDKLPSLKWQPSELPEMIGAIEAWRQESGRRNFLAPIAMDVDRPDAPFDHTYDFGFTANTIHFVSAETARNLLAVMANHLRSSGKLLVYGPFNDRGDFTSEGNERLDAWLKQRDPQSGLQDIQWLQKEACKLGFSWLETRQLPANNLLVVFKKT